MPGAYVFPGGRLERSDQGFGAFLASDLKNVARIETYFAGSKKVTAHLAAAIRETLEESGISILRLLDQEMPTFCSAERLRHLLTHHEGASQAVLDNIWPISWWVTPRGETRRFNTWFFLATAEDSVCDLTSHPLQDETTSPMWLFPADALAAYANGSIFLAPPTRSILERMAKSASLADFLSYVDRPLRPIKPYFVDDLNQKLLVLPGDPLHHEKQKSSMPMHTRYSFP